MALWTAADVITFAPEFCDVPIPVIDKFIAAADLQIGDCWGDRATYAGVLLTAHMLTVSKVKDGSGAGGSGAGPVQSVTVGQVSVTYGSGIVSSALSRGLSAGLAGSSYGIEFDRLSQLMAAGAAVV